MRQNYLFPHSYKKIGQTVFFLGLLFGILSLIYEDGIQFFDWRVFAFVSDAIFVKTRYFEFIQNNWLDELTCIFVILGGMIFAFSKEKIEDEFIGKLRTESLIWAIFVNYGILLIAVVFIYDLSFFWVLSFNMFTPLIFFLIRFRWALKRLKDDTNEE